MVEQGELQTKSRPTRPGAAEEDDLLEESCPGQNGQPWSPAAVVSH